MLIELDDPKFWTAIAFIVFVALVYKKVTKLLTGALDDRAAQIKSELDEARQLREEAEAVLEEYKQKQAEYLKEAEIILADARRDADLITRHAQEELQESLDMRLKNALERIAQEEGKAITEVRNHVVDISLAAARALIAEHVSTMSGDELLKLALADIERKIH